ncbi:uncharacterized protein LOC131614640 [Vicia villosa]|uniref:uncharacterized protein LOC131614640 n=1 Tax=Vicia villosa TaxID=3911 RepID=UPI00273C1E53|nr:uncharacterized protein LOC131614640 [Vicia villosa]
MYYVKEGDVMDLQIKDSFSWILKGILKLKDQVKDMGHWKDMLQKKKFNMKVFYWQFLEQTNNVDWRGMLIGNSARPQAKIVLWLACHGRLATKDWLVKFGMIQEAKCEFCDANETLQHLFFECRGTKFIWQDILQWLHIDHQVNGWMQEHKWAIKICKSNNWRRNFLKVALAETIYVVWKLRNNRVYRKDSVDSDIVTQIIDNVVNRVWGVPKVREKLGFLLL